MSHTLDEVAGRIARLEDRVTKMESAMTKQGQALPEIRMELSSIRQVVRILEDIVKRFEIQFAAMSKEDRDNFQRLHEHMTKDAGDRSKVLVGVFTAGASGLVTLVVFAWGIFEVLQRMP